MSEGTADALRAAIERVLADVEPLPLGPGMDLTPAVRYDSESIVALRAILAGLPDRLLPLRLAEAMQAVGAEIVGRADVRVGLYWTDADRIAAEYERLA